jgi:hypothetical protein
MKRSCSKLKDSIAKPASKSSVQGAPFSWPKVSRRDMSYCCEKANRETSVGVWDWQVNKDPHCDLNSLFYHTQHGEINRLMILAKNSRYPNSARTFRRVEIPSRYDSDILPCVLQFQFQPKIRRCIMKVSKAVHFFPRVPKGQREESFHPNLFHNPFLV